MRRSIGQVTSSAVVLGLVAATTLVPEVASATPPEPTREESAATSTATPAETPQPAETPSADDSGGAAASEPDRADSASPTTGAETAVDGNATAGSDREPDEASAASSDGSNSSITGDPAAASVTEVPRPPRVDGAFVGGTMGVGMTFTRVNGLETPSPMIGPVGLLSAGDAVFPWLTIGIAFYGGGGRAGDQRVGHGGLLLDVGLLPAPKRAPFSFRLGAGFGAGAVRDANETARFGFGGALFRGGVRYEFFPTAAKRRPNRGGGWSIGPELTWLGETPAAAGRPMANTILLGLWTGFYFGS